MKHAFVICTALALMTCGPAPEKEAPQPTVKDPAFEKVKATVDRVCGKCHNGVIQSPNFNSARAFKTLEVKRRIENDSMPPGGAIKAADKKALLDYLNG